MEDLCNQPFLLLLRQAVEQTGDFQGYETLLQERQSAFKEYVYEYYSSEMPAPKRFYFLKRADYEVCIIRQKYSKKIKEKDENFYQFWEMMIDDTLRFISIGVDTLEFQRKCPAHMLTETVQSFPACIWTAHKIDLMEAMVGLHQIDAIRLQDGSRPSFPLFVQSIGNIFGITFDDPKKEAHKVLTRKKNPTPFFERIITVLKNKKTDMDGLNF